MMSKEDALYELEVTLPILKDTYLAYRKGDEDDVDDDEVMQKISDFDERVRSLAEIVFENDIAYTTWMDDVETVLSGSKIDWKKLDRFIETLVKFIENALSIYDDRKRTQILDVHTKILENRLDEATAEITALKERIVKFSEQNEKLKRACNKLKQEVDVLRDEKDKLHEMFLQCEAEKTECQKESQELRNRIKSFLVNLL